MNRSISSAVLLLCAALTAACDDHSAQSGILAATAGSPAQVTQSFSMPVRATVTTAATGCDNSPGPYITIEGGLSLGGLGTRMTFTNNAKGTHTFSDDAHVDITVDVRVVAEGM